MTFHPEIGLVNIERSVEKPDGQLRVIEQVMG
jgi:hypothetical protein